MDFLGDAALKFLLSAHLYGCLEPLTNKKLTETRSKLECNQFFGYLVVKHGLQRFLRSGSRVLNEEVVSYVMSIGNRVRLYRARVTFFKLSNRKKHAL